MEIKKTYIGKYFKNSVIYLFKSKLIFFIISFIEFYELLICLINFEEIFFYLDKNYYETKTFLKNILLQIAPYPYYNDFLKKSDGQGFDRNYIFIIIYLMFLMGFYLYLFFEAKEDKNQKNSMKKIFHKICINFFDFFLFRLFPLYGFDCITRGILRISAKSPYRVYDIFIQFILLCFYFTVIFSHIYYFRNVCLWNNFKIVDSYINSYPYDIFFSEKYDIVFFILKLLVSLAQSYLEYNKDVLNIIVIFITFIFIFISYSFTLYTFYLIFLSKDSLYIYMNFYNKLRIFYILLIFECLLFRLALHVSGDHIPYLLYIVILIIFNTYFVTSKFYEYLYTFANTSQNFLSVCWFVLSNDINRQDFIIEWISNHKKKCNLKSSECPICSKLKMETDIYSEKNLIELKKEIVQNQFINSNSKSKSKNKKEMTKIEKRTLISIIFPPFVFFNSLIKMIKIYKKTMSQDDLIRLDFINLITLFLNEEKGIDFIIFNRTGQCLLKYQNNSRVLMTFILFFDLLKTSDKYCNQKFEILQKNEELRNSLTLYLKEYEDFLLYKTKSPMNYYDISSKYKSFRDLLVNIHIYFRKNLECNYELIIMRYIYEILINAKFSHMQLFDLNNYSEFLEYHFTNCRTFLLKYNIEKDLFLIIKASKEIHRYQGKFLTELFPEEFTNIALKKFKSQLNDIEAKDSKHLYEFIVESNYKNFGFIEAFKMNYSIYPTNLINDLFIQGNYRIGYYNLIIFIYSCDGEEFLYSYSYQIYKYFGITPQDISLLSKNGIIIYFENIFNKKNILNNKDEKYKNEYIFKYKNYFSLFKQICSFDILKESQNYSQIKEKQKQFEIYAKEDKEIIFLINKKWELKENSKIYNIYSIKEIKKKKLKKNIGEKESRIRSTYSQLNDKEEIKNDFEEEETENDDEDINEFGSEEDIFEGKGIAMGGSTLSSLSMSQRSESTDSSKLKGKKDEKAEEKKEKQRQLYKTVYIILGFGILIIIISIIFLVIENIKNTQFKNLVYLFNTFHIYKRGIETLPLTILANYKFQIDEMKYNNLFEEYSNNLGKKYNSLSQLNLSTFLLIDAQEQLSSIITSFNDYQKELYSLGEELSNKIENLMGKTYKLKVEEDKLFFYKLDINILSIGREYLNILTALLENNNFTEIYFQLMSAGDLVDNMRTIYRSNSGDINSLGKNMILLLLTYPFLHNGLFTISSLILNKGYNIVNSIKNTYIVFYCVLLILHLILLFIGINFMLAFVKIIKLIILNGNKIFEDKQFLEFQEKRLNQIKIMKNLYTENPIKIMEKLDLIEDIYKNSNSHLKKKINIIQTFENDKNYLKEEDKEKNINNDLISKKNTKKNSKNNGLLSPAKKSISDSLKITINENDKSNNHLNKNEFNSINISNINEKVSFLNKKMKFNQFTHIIILEYFMLFMTFILYLVYSIIMIILIIYGINRLKYLVDYLKYNDYIDGYIYDNTNAILYIIETNSSSFYYGNLVDPTYNQDYIQENIELLYDAIIIKDDIEETKESAFVPVGEIFNLNCSKGVGKDKLFVEIIKRFNVNYDEYFAGLCKKFPVASTGDASSLFYEIIYLVGRIYRKYESSDSFYNIFENNLNQTQLFDLFTLTMTFFRMRRNNFYDSLIMDEINIIISYFSSLILIYLIISIICEVVIFLVLYCCVIKQVKKKDHQFNNFIDSFRYD